MRKHGVLISILCLLALLSIASGIYVPTAQVLTKPEILDPTYSIAQIVRPSSWFVAELRGPEGSLDSSALSAYLACSIDQGVSNISLTIAGFVRDANRYSINLSIPFISIPQGSMYPCSLVINTKGVSIISERSVYIHNKSFSRLGIMHITDIHLLLPTPLGTAFQTLTSAVLLANALSDIDIVINTGDTVDRPGDASLYPYYITAVKTLVKPLLAVPGNHDGSGISPDVFSAVYGSNVGKPTWYRRIDSYLIIGLDTSSSGVIDRSQLAFLENTLKLNMDAATKIVLLHHPIFRASAKGVYINQPLASVDRNLLYASWANAEDIARDLLRIIDTYNVSAVLAGHVHEDSIVIYRNKTMFITTGTLGGPRSYYNAFRIIDAYSNGTVIPRLAPGTSLTSDMNSYNVEKAVVRYWLGDRYSGLFINISRDLGIPARDLDIYLESPAKGSITIERITYDDNKKQLIEAISKIQILGEDGAIRTLYIVRIPSQEIYRPQSIVLRDRAMDTSPKPSIADISITPPQPRSNIDPVIVDIKVSSGATYVYRVETRLVAITKGGSTEIYGEALPGWDYTSYQIIYDKINAASANLTVKAYDLYGNSDEKTINIRFREQATPTQTITITQPATTTTQPAQQTTTRIVATTATQATSPAMITTTGAQYGGQTASPTTAVTTPAQQGSGGQGFPLTVVLIAVIAIVVLIAVIAVMRGRARGI